MSTAIAKLLKILLSAICFIKIFRKHIFADIVKIKLNLMYKLVGYKCNTKINYFTKIQII